MTGTEAIPQAGPTAEDRPGTAPRPSPFPRPSPLARHSARRRAQIEYWKELPGLVKDGIYFSWRQTIAFYEWARDKKNGVPSDPALKRALSQNEDGGPTTDYSEATA